jgi:putative FmdB family regulatory protein
MPIYEYKCKDCDTVREIQHGMSELPEDKSCLVCNSDNTVKIISVTSRPQFKGGGFYETDYKSKES